MFSTFKQTMAFIFGPIFYVNTIYSTLFPKLTMQFIIIDRLLIGRL